jgi:adenine-specific DNA methylase
MDDSGLWERKDKSIPMSELYSRLTPKERAEWFVEPKAGDKPKYKKSVRANERKRLQRLVFDRLSYDEKLDYCCRPEQIDGPPTNAWTAINDHLGTDAQNIADLIGELGQRRFGHVPRVGDSFCGGGSIPFEAARIGCGTYGSDLSPVAALLTLASLHIVGGGADVVDAVRRAQQEVYDTVDRQITEWKIEHNEEGMRADAYLYCTEAFCPECGWLVPLAPSWVIGEKTRCVAKLIPEPERRRFKIDVESGVSDVEMVRAKESGTAVDSYLICPNPKCGQKTPFAALREHGGSGNGGRTGLRLWGNMDVVPRPNDVFQERLYCIRWVETYEDKEGKPRTRRFYRAPDEDDLDRERKVYNLLMERFSDWQEKGYIPSRKIEPGERTDEPIRTRGWTHWHHLFNPRQLLNLGLLGVLSASHTKSSLEKIGCLLGIGCSADYNSRLSRWHPHGANEKSEQVFTNQALNTLVNYAVRGLSATQTCFVIREAGGQIPGGGIAEPSDARNLSSRADIWLTDPPYADAINYHELSEFFLAWYEKHLVNLFPEWYGDSKRALAITGTGEAFRKSMVDCYKNLAAHMPDNGMQVVMFTHQDARVWADLALILWAAGLRVSAAWCIATETESALKEGNYVQGTVLLVLRKRTSENVAFLDEIHAGVEDEVKTQLQSMLALEDQEDPNFGDSDFQLAAYAAALRVLTRYKGIEDVDIAYELTRVRKKDEISPIEAVIAAAVKIASDFLVPRGFDDFVWKLLTPMERLYLKGLEVESHGEFRSGVYQEFARGFGAGEYKSIIATGKANRTRLKTAAEFGAKELGGSGFGASLVRNALFAVWEVVRTGEVKPGKNWLRNEVPDYWGQRKNLISITRYFASMGFSLAHWKADAEAARLLGGALENDHV